jgi:uncharacterized protein (TIGR02217 family)
LRSGHEQRNQIWTTARHRYQIQNLKLAEEIDEVINFFNAMRGRLHGFRFKDWADYKSGSNYADISMVDAVVSGTVDSANKTFHLVKHYTVGNTTYTRKIIKPIASTVVMAVDGSATTAFTVVGSTGVVTTASAYAPGTVLTAGFEFDVPVRFDTDVLDLRHEFFQGASIPIPLVEIRDY